MDVYQNIEVLYILQKNLLDKFVWKTFHMIDQVKMNKLRQKNSILPSFKKNIW